MATKATGPLQGQLQAVGIVPAAFCAVFDAWKAGFPGTELTNYRFGKDGAYTTPKVDGKQYVLRHVHLVPVSDQTKLAEWNALFDEGTDKGHWKLRTSDRALIYATRTVPGQPDEHLLMYILTEPDAHKIARMKTKNDREFMEQFAECASAFLLNGTVIW